MPSRARQTASRVTAAPFQCRLVILAKAPVAGDVKTRLAREVGVTAATRFYRHAMASVIARLGSQPFWHTVIAAAPEAALRSAIWPAGMRRVCQDRGDIGRRMQRPMRRLPPGPVCVIGTDIPDIEVDHVRRAFRLLGRRDVVFGPAEDGGFWLVGMRRRPRVPDPYSRVRWSSPHALGDTLSNLAGLSVGFTATLHDVDTAGDLRRVAARFGRRVRPPSRF